MLLEVFNQRILVKNNLNLDLFLPYEKEFKYQLDNLVLQPNFASYVTSEQTGNARTTVNEPYRSVRTLRGVYFLMSSLYPYFIEAKEQVLGDTSTYLRFGRAWVNYMFKGCGGYAHTHNPRESDLVGIFYMSVPSGSGELVIIDSELTGVHEKQIDASKKYNIKPTQHSFVCHTSTVNHAITDHQSDEDRISIIIEAKLQKK